MRQSGKSLFLNLLIKSMSVGESIAYVSSDGVRILRLEEYIEHGQKGIDIEEPIIYDETGEIDYERIK